MNKPRGKPFEKGWKGGPGGARPGSGRPLGYFKQLASETLKKHHLIERLGRIADGEDLLQVATNQGEALPLPATVSNQLRATELLLNRADGMPKNELEIVGEDDLSEIREDAQAIRKTVARQDQEGI